MPSAAAIGAFLCVSLVLAVSIGPAVVFIVSRSPLHGRCAGVASVTGSAFIGLVGLGALAAMAGGRSGK